MTQSEGPVLLGAPLAAIRDANLKRRGEAGRPHAYVLGQRPPETGVPAIYVLAGRRS